MAAETESVAQGSVHDAFTGCTKGEIEFTVDLRIIGKVVDRRGDDVILNSQYSSDGFDNSGTAQ